MGSDHEGRKTQSFFLSLLFVCQPQPQFRRVGTSLAACKLKSSKRSCAPNAVQCRQDVSLLAKNVFAIGKNLAHMRQLKKEVTESWGVMMLIEGQRHFARSYRTCVVCACTARSSLSQNRRYAHGVCTVSEGGCYCRWFPTPFSFSVYLEQNGAALFEALSSRWVGKFAQAVAHLDNA